jgi:hypothetical protein
MFEAELEMEEREHSIIPLLLIIAVMLTIVGGVIFFVLQMHRQITPQQATPAVAAWLEQQSPAALHFRSGLVKSSVDEKPDDPHYRLLAKLGFLHLKILRDRSADVVLTPKGKEQLEAIPGYQATDTPDKTVAYEVPLARKQLVQVSRVTMQGAKAAVVEYTWKWATTPLGDLFDASNPTFKSFPTWDRAVLIDKYGVNYYHSDPIDARVRIVEIDGKWRVAGD